ncbi:MAG: adenylate/guanylate cyclase domain-containing protein [Spirochaetia bacterium]|nr:adenylate/guanylate cyclase domain-containing protein [Spirochaetia bacterium]
MTPPVRYQLSLLVARFFRRHLEAELTKPVALMQAVTYEGLTFHDMTVKMLADLDREFPEAVLEPVAFNMFEQWWADGVGPVQVPYAKSTFKLYNQGFLARLIDLKHGTDSSRRAMLIRYGKILEGARERGRELTFGGIYALASRMSEALRRIVTDHGLGDDAWSILLEQHDALNDATFSYFDRALKASLKRADDILTTVLPLQIAEELKTTGYVKPRHVESASVMFADIVGFTNIAEQMPPEDLIAEINRCFSHFDAIMEQNRLEKIKTIGDCYMCAGGILSPNQTHAVDAVLCGLRIQEFMRKYKKSREKRGLTAWELRIGIHTGPVTGGIVGLNRFNFDIWGDTVNTASRIQSSGMPGTVNISRRTAEQVGDFFELEERGRIAAKNKGELEMFFVKGIHPQLSVRSGRRVPNFKFSRLYHAMAGGAPQRV